MESEPKKEQVETPKAESAAPTAAPAPTSTPTSPTSATPTHGGGIAIAALVIGIIAACLCWVPFLGLALGVTAIVLGIIGLKHKANKGMSIAGLITGSAATLWNLVVSALLIMTFMGLAAVGTGLTGIFGGLSGLTNGTTNVLSQYTASEQAKIDAKKDFAKGETAIFDKFEVKVNSVRRNYVPDDQYSQASEGKELIVVNVSIKNTDTSSAYFSSYSLDINDNGISNGSSYISASPELNGGDISAGATTTGNVVYEVTKDATSLKLQYEETAYSTTEGLKTLTYTLAI
jgi:hypothetical protein